MISCAKLRPAQTKKTQTLSLSFRSHGKGDAQLHMFSAGHGPTAATGDQCRPVPRFQKTVVSCDEHFAECAWPAMACNGLQWAAMSCISVKVAPNSLAEDWNRRCPGRAVRKGYRLVKVPWPTRFEHGYNSYKPKSKAHKPKMCIQTAVRIREDPC